MTDRMPVQVRLARFLLPLLPLVTVGCASMTPTERGVGGGALIGGGTGAVIGNALGNTGAGAAIGAGIGAVTGGLVGNSVEQGARGAAARPAAQEQRAMLTKNDVIQLAQQRVSDDIIINHVRTSGSVFHLTAQDIVDLKQVGVSDGVVREMQQTAYRPPPPPRQAYGMVYGPPPPPVVILEPPPPPGFSVGIGYRRCR